MAQSWLSRIILGARAQWQPESQPKTSTSPVQVKKREEWRAIHESQNYVGLVKYCQQRVEKFPDDPDVQYHLGEAYVLNGEYEKAIQCLSAPYRQNSNNPNFQHVILDALFALGKSLQRRITVC